MSFSPFARYRNFTLDNLKALLEIYPDCSRKLTWNEAKCDIDEILPAYSKTAYQQACQLGLEDRASSRFRVQSYLYAFNDDMLEKYLEFWFKLYFAPNPYVNSYDEAVKIYCDLIHKILESDTLAIDYDEYFDITMGAGSKDILLNAIRAYGSPIKCQLNETKTILYIEEADKTTAIYECQRIENDYPIRDRKSKREFFDRFSYKNFCHFYGISLELPLNSNYVENEKEERITGGENILYYGVPGSGKSYAISKICSNEKLMERVVFHPDYTYSDFVGQILPRVVEGKVQYVFTPGPFTRIMKKAQDNPQSMFYLVIEELNRGNAPAIFGEIFQLLDRADREEVLKHPNKNLGESVYGISNYDMANEMYNGDSERFIKIPSNLTILATMNTSDQNVFTLDTAFQRRWNMKQIPNDFNNYHAEDVIEGSDIKWGSFAEVVNDMVLEVNKDFISSEDKRLGSFFAKKEELSVDKFPQKVLKYLWDDSFKMNREDIFIEKYRSLEEVVKEYETSECDKLKSVLRLEVYNKMLEKTEKNKVINEEDTNQ